MIKAQVSDSISYIKQEIKKNEDFPIDKYCVIYKGKELDNNKIIADYNIPKNSTLELALRILIQLKMSMKFLLIYFLILTSNCSFIDDFIKKLRCFLQTNVDNQVIVDFMEIVRKITKKYTNHLEKNREAFKNHINYIKTNKGFIEDQKNYTDMSYGIFHLSKNGCGTIATYNVLYALTGNNDIDYASIVDDYEKDGIALYGLLGTSGIAIEDYFKKNGFKTMSSSIEEDFDKIGFETDASVVLVYNDRDDILDSIHYMAITKHENKFYFHNLHKGGGVPSNVGYESVMDGVSKINNGKSKGIFFLNYLRI